MQDTQVAVSYQELCWQSIFMQGREPEFKYLLHELGELVYFNLHHFHHIMAFHELCFLLIDHVIRIVAVHVMSTVTHHCPSHLHQHMSRNRRKTDVLSTASLHVPCSTSYAKTRTIILITLHEWHGKMVDYTKRGMRMRITPKFPLSKVRHPWSVHTVASSKSYANHSMGPGPIDSIVLVYAFILSMMFIPIWITFRHQCIHTLCQWWLSSIQWNPTLFGAYPSTTEPMDTTTLR